LPEGEGMPHRDMDDADAPWQMREHQGAAMLPRVMEKLMLTGAQKKDVDRIVFDAAKETIAQRAKVATARLELRQLVNADSPDKNAIEKKINEVDDLSTQIHINRVDGWFAINKLLTPDQQKIWKQALLDRPQMQQGHVAGSFGEGGKFQGAHRRMPGNGKSLAPPQP
jgi:Spy/CpxP family protein refolding chaperone